MWDIILWGSLLTILGITIITFGKKRSKRLNLILFILSFIIAINYALFLHDTWGMVGLLIWIFLTFSAYNDYEDSCKDE